MEEPRKKGKTIQRTVRTGLCTGCGSCAGTCPQSAIEMAIDEERGTYVPKVNLNKCNQCGICYRLCPGYSVDFRQLNMEMFGKAPEDALIGNYLNCYVGHSKDYGIRYNSSSGGLVTQLLIFALEKGIIDGALVTRMSDKDPLRPEPFIAKTREEIISASKSKYCPVPANVALKEILNSGGRFAVVGLPCHIHGLRKAMSMNRKLRESIHLTFGLMCSGNRSFLATEYVLQRLGTTKANVVKLDYRGDGYLGSMRVKLKNGREKSVPYIEYDRWLRSFFYLPRCTLCIDHTCEMADISFGDNCLPEFQEESVGSSIIICRTKPAEELVAAALSSGSIELSDVECSRVVQSKREALLRKKCYIGARVTLFKLFGRRTPIYDEPPLKGEPFAYLDAVATYLQIYISSKRSLWRLLSKFATFLRLASTLRESEHTDSRSYRKRPNPEQRRTNRQAPPSCGHIMINDYLSRLVTENLISRSCLQTYESFNERKGTAYHLLADGMTVRSENFLSYRKYR